MPASCTHKKISASACILLSLATAGCVGHGQARPMNAAQVSAQLREVLPQLEKGHNDKCQLAWYVSWFRSVSPPVRQFSNSMGKNEKRLRHQLKQWARKHHVSLKFHYGHDVTGMADKSMEHEQGNIIKSDSKTTFQRDFLILMFTDYDWQEHLAKALLPYAKSPGLHQYLTESVAYHKRGVQQLRALLQHYHYAP